jgi:hypothetical protein
MLQSLLQNSTDLCSPLELADATSLGQTSNPETLGTLTSRWSGTASTSLVKLNHSARVKLLKRETD